MKELKKHPSLVRFYCFYIYFNFCELFSQEKDVLNICDFVNEIKRWCFSVIEVSGCRISLHGLFKDM